MERKAAALPMWCGAAEETRHAAGRVLDSDAELSGQAMALWQQSDASPQAV